MSRQRRPRARRRQPWRNAPGRDLALFRNAAVAFATVAAASSLEAEQKKEVTLKEDYKKKLAQAVNLDALKKQREQVQQYVTQLEKQLPSKAEMVALLSDIKQAGLGLRLTFELFKPGLVCVKE